MPVCPACAGMIRNKSPDKPQEGRLPRMRGDDPTCEKLQDLQSEFAPHARG